MEENLYSIKGKIREKRINRELKIVTVLSNHSAANECVLYDVDDFKDKKYEKKNLPFITTLP